MNIFITGICGFAGYTLARGLQACEWVTRIRGVDNLCRNGSEVHLPLLRESGIEVDVEDIRNEDYFRNLEPADWVIDAAAQPSVLAGVDGQTSSLELVQHNLYGTINILEYCKRCGGGFTLLSTSRVYGLAPLESITVEVEGDGYQPAGEFPEGFSGAGIREGFSTAPPVSLYGATKVASERMALEYGEAFSFPVWINRCGVLAGARQFGHPTQGIFSFWLHSWRNKRPLKYIGFDGLGHQVRDCLHPLDLIPVLEKQIRGRVGDGAPRISNFSGGAANAYSLKRLSSWCERRWGAHEVGSEPANRKYDLPWIVLDSSQAEAIWGFRVQRPIESILEEIAAFADANPQWLDLSLGKQAG